MIRILLICLLSLLSSPGLLLAREVFFYHNDNVGTPVAMTDSAGKVVWRAHDKPFGEEFQTTEAPEHNSRRFIGKEKDKETGLVYIGARYLDPASGRFLQPDPVGPVDPMTGKVNVEMLANPQRLNRYAYGLNNPYRYIDPDGKMSRDIEDGINPFEMTEGYAPRGGGGISSGSSGVRGSVASKGIPSIKWGAQEKHFPGHNSYTPGRSTMTADPTKLAEKAGTGQKVGNIQVGQPGSKERVNFGEKIGAYIDQAGNSSPTTNGIIHYSKDGIHIVPARP